MPSDFFTLEFLSTFAGMTAAVAVIVQFTKEFVKDSFPDWAVRLYALIVSAAVQFFVLYVQDGLTVENIGLGVINTVLVTLTAIGAYDVISDPNAEKSKPGN